MKNTALITLKDLCENNDYFKEIELLIETNKKNPPTIKPYHKHHIIPRSWFKIHGLEVDNSKSNIVILNLKDHYKIHLLLSKCMKEQEMKYKMNYAASRLKNWKPSKCSNKNSICNNIKKDNNIIKKKNKSQKGKWARYLDNHLNELSKLSFEDQIKYLNNLNPQIKYQVLTRIIYKKYKNDEILCRRQTKLYKKHKIDEKTVLNWITT